MGSAKSSLENLHFTLSGYSYTIYRESAVFETNGSGIRVKTPDGNSSRLRCKEDSPISDLYVLDDLGLRKLPQEALVSSEEFETWPAESANVDLLQGVKTHDLALVSQALGKGADINFRGQYDVGVLGEVADQRPLAVRAKRVAAFDQETEQLLAFLLAHGASPTISTQNGATAIDFLATRGSFKAVRTLLNVGWPTDYHYRLYVGALLGDPVLVQEALDHGADPNKPIRGSGPLLSAIGRASQLSWRGLEAEQEQALTTMELLLKAGANIDEGTPTSGGGEVVRVYAYSGNQENIKPVLDLLVRYATPVARKNALYWLKIGTAGPYPQRRANLDWLLKRLEQ